MTNPEEKLNQEKEHAITEWLQLCKLGCLFETPKPINNPKISIIIPIYNKEKNITLLLRSIQNQTFKEIEIVCVDDNSTDYTFQMLRFYQKEDRRIKIIHNEINRGVLYSRIYGALHSKGDYILFANAEDAFCDKNTFENIYKEMQNKKVDIIHFQSCGGLYKDGFNFETPKLLLRFCPFDLDKIITQPDLKNFYLTKKNNEKESENIFDKLFSRKCFEKMAKIISEPFWQLHLIYIDDFLFNIAAMKVAESYCMINELAYWHWIKNDNVTNYFYGFDGFNLKNPEKDNKKILDYVLIKEKIFQLMENNSKACDLMLYIVRDMEKEECYDILPRSIYFERFLNIYKKFMNWKYCTKDARKKAYEGVQKFMKNKIDVQYKYMELFTPDVEDNWIVERNTKVFKETRLKFLEENEKNKEVIKYEFNDVE